VNASASAIDREGEVQSRIRKVRTFSRGARVVCSALFAFGLVGAAVGLLMAVFGPKLTTVEQKLWVGLVLVTLVGAWLIAIHQLYRLFTNLAKGVIYTPENVRRLRLVGLLWLLGSLLAIVIPFTSSALVSAGFIDTSFPFKGMFAFPSLSEWLSSIFAAGLVLLASWIMDIGLYEKDHADALERDAELVI
jgi:hypothetical protein